MAGRLIAAPGNETYHGKRTMKSFVTDCDYCGSIKLCTEDGAGGKGCRPCLEEPAKEPMPRFEEGDRVDVQMAELDMETFGNWSDCWDQGTVTKVTKNNNRYFYEIDLFSGEQCVTTEDKVCRADF